MDASHINKVKAPQHFKTRRSHREEAALVVDDRGTRLGRRGDVQVPSTILGPPPAAHVVVLQRLLALGPDATCAERRRGPNGLKFDKETTHFHHSWRRFIKMA